MAYVRKTRRTAEKSRRQNRFALFQTGGKNAMLVVFIVHDPGRSMRELKDDLASLRIDREAPRREPLACAAGACCC